MEDRDREADTTIIRRCQGRKTAGRRRGQAERAGRVCSRSIVADDAENPETKLVVSTGNVAFIVVRLMVLVGQFNYGRRGILDLTHARLFTFGTFRRLFAFQIFAAVRPRPGLEYLLDRVRRESGRRSGTSAER